MENERIAIIETNLDHIKEGVDSMNSMLIKHIEHDSEIIKKNEAYKAFANKTTEAEVLRVRICQSRMTWGLVTGASALAVALTMIIIKGLQWKILLALL